ncbi:MAG: amidohydrolase family protein [Bacillota bacterium]|nr:amidohydrolase family protein [Bacillota bacterium]
MKKLIKCGTLVDGSGSEPVKGATLVIEDGIIKEVLASAPPVDQDTVVIDLSAKTVMPGLIDTHVHLTMGANPAAPVPEITLQTLNAAQDALRHGVTTLRDVGSGHGIGLAIRRAVARGLVLGPRVWSAHRIVTMTGGHAWQGGIQADGKDAILRAVREMVRDGADFIKTTASHRAPRPEYTQEEIDLLVAEAHRLGKKVACHVGLEPGYGMAVRAGVDSVEHGTIPTDETLEEMARRRTPVIPTLMVMGNGFYKVNRFGRPPKSLDQFYLRDLDDFEHIRDYFEESTNRVRHVIAFARKHGIPVGAGTDSPLQNLPFYSVIYETERLVEFGLEPMQAIMAATSVNARVMGLENKIGTLAPGLVADVIAVDGDPLADITKVRNVCFVMKEGKVIPDPQAALGPTLQA